MPSTARRWHPIQAVNAYDIRLVWLRDHREGTWVTVPWRLLSSTATPERFGRHCPCWMSMASGKAIGWWQRQGWIEGDPTIGIERRPAPPDRIKALAENHIAALWRLDVALREKTQWKMLYESAARADEVLCLNVEDLYPQDKPGRITAKGGATAWIHWQSGTAQLLPRLIARRTRGPLFLTDR